MTATAGAAEPDETPAAPVEPPAGEARAYLGFGLTTVSHTVSLPQGDFDSSGAGLVANGVGYSRPLNPSLDIAFRGELSLAGREFDAGGADTADVMFELDGGMRLSRWLLLTLGYTTHTIAYDVPDEAFTYTVVPVGIGILHTRDDGYLLAQFRVGGGRLGNDQNDATESVGYAGFRAVFQRGFDSGMQFMVGLGLDAYDVGDTGEDERFFRLEFGLGFGL